MDVKKSVSFEEYYEDEYHRAIKRYYESVKNKKTFCIIVGFVTLIFLIALLEYIFKSLNLFEILNEYYTVVKYSCFTILAIIIFIPVYISLKKEMYGINEHVIRDILLFINEGDSSKVEYKPKSKLSNDSLNKMELFNLDVVRYTGKNFSTAYYKKHLMTFADINTYIYDVKKYKKIIYRNGKKRIRTYTKRKKHNIFDGIYIGATLNKENSAHIYLIPNNLSNRVLQSKIMNFIKYEGKPVMLENLDFSNKYKVFCNDEIQARYILSLSLMEKINNLDEQFKCKKYIVFKEGKRFAICMEGITIEDIRKINLPIFRNKNRELKVLNKVYERIKSLFEIYDILGLDNDLYVKKI